MHTFTLFLAALIKKPWFFVCHQHLRGDGNMHTVSVYKNKQEKNEFVLFKSEYDYFVTANPVSF